MNATQIRALSTDILMAFEDQSDWDFPGESFDDGDTVGNAIRHLMDSNQGRATKVSLADSAKHYWLKAR